MAGVQDTYLRYDAAGDQYVGRTVCGLPVCQASFATLPPFFEHPDAHITTAIAQMFPAFPADLHRVAEFCLASLVYHNQWLRSNLPVDHPLFLTPIFRSPIMMTALSSKVVCRIALPSDPIGPTGIPPHTMIMNELLGIRDDFRSQSDKSLNAIQVASARCVEEIMTGLEERSVSANVVTRHGLTELIQGIMQQAGLYDAVDRLNNPIQGAPTSSSSSTTSSSTGHSCKLYTWGGALHLVPEDFTFPKVST
jgi:hypothetical protein